MRRNSNKAFHQKLFDNFRNTSNSPVYDSRGDVIYQRKVRINRKLLITSIVIASILLVLSGIIYLPQLFISDALPNEPITTSDKDAYMDVLQYVREHGGDDFDKDGLSNYKELEAKTDPFFNDTDKDGILDGHDHNPTKKNDTLYNAILSTGNSIKTPYQINGVILWPDNKNAWTYGAVIPVRNGYQFTGFNGWAKFPEGKYAYQYVDGRHTLLKHNEKANTWKITKDCVVVLMDKQPENTYLVSFFGKETYIRNGFGKFLSWLLPEKGWITAKTMWLDDTFIDTSSNTYAPYKKQDSLPYLTSRYGQYSKTLKSLSDVYHLIDTGHPVLASIVSEERGETIVEIYGYTYAGHLIVADPHIKSANGILTIDVRCERALSPDGKITENSWFEFYGCGYDSLNGAMISFFSTADSKDGA